MVTHCPSPRWAVYSNSSSRDDAPAVSLVSLRDHFSAERVKLPHCTAFRWYLWVSQGTRWIANMFSVDPPDSFRKQRDRCWGYLLELRALRCDSDAVARGQMLFEVQLPSATIGWLGEAPTAGSESSICRIHLEDYQFPAHSCGVGIVQVLATWKASLSPTRLYNRTSLQFPPPVRSPALSVQLLRLLMPGWMEQPRQVPIAEKKLHSLTPIIDSE